jgi:hypothetical protein
MHSGSKFSCGQVPCYKADCGECCSPHSLNETVPAYLTEVLLGEGLRREASFQTHAVNAIVGMTLELWKLLKFQTHTQYPPCRQHTCICAHTQQSLFSEFSAALSPCFPEVSSVSRYNQYLSFYSTLNQHLKTYLCKLPLK